MKSLFRLSALLLILGWTSASCIHYPRFTFGQMPGSHACVAVFPLVDLSSQGASDDLLGEYLTLALMNSGFRATLGPRDVKGLYESIGMQLPGNIDQNKALHIGRKLEADGVLYGHVSKYPLQNKLAPTDNPEIWLGIDLYLVDIKDRSIAWIYSTRIYSNKKNLLSDMAKLSSDISRTLLITSGDLAVVNKGSCWDRPKIALNLSKGTAVPVRPTTAKPKARPSTKPAPKKKVVLTGQAKQFYQTLVDKKPVVLKNLFAARTNKWNPKPAAMVLSLARAMAAFPSQAKFEIQGHTDATPSRDKDFWVSARQAGKVQEVLVKKAPSLKGRINISAKGGMVPIMPNINRVSRQNNRRMEVRLVR